MMVDPSLPNPYLYWGTAGGTKAPADRLWLRTQHAAYRPESPPEGVGMNWTLVIALEPKLSAEGTERPP